MIARFTMIVPVLLAAGVFCQGQESGPVQVVIKDGKVVALEPTLPVDPTPIIQPGYSGGIHFGLSVEGKRITCSPQGSIWASARVDDQVVNQGFGGMVMAGQPQPLPPAPYGKKRHGSFINYQMGVLHVTQTVELVPGKPREKLAAGQKRKLDTARISYLVENKDTRAHKVEWRVGIDILIVNNDGALFAAPTTHPGQILNGVILKDKTLPDYLQVMERPNLKDPGFVAHMTFKLGSRADCPSRVVLTNLTSMGAGWDVPAQQAGDAACALYWDAKTLNPGEKREFVWAYGGGVAGNPENEGKVAIALGGSFEPGKVFTIMAHVDDPVTSQTLTLELPPGMQRVEGKEIQPVPEPVGSGTSIVLWKARVLQTGEHEVKVRSSTGVTQIKNITIRPR